MWVILRSRGRETAINMDHVHTFELQAKQIRFAGAIQSVSGSFETEQDAAGKFSELVQALARYTPEARTVLELETASIE